MTCEFCNQNRMDVKTWSSGPSIMANLCTPCARRLTELELEHLNNFREQVKQILENAKRLAELKR